MHSSVLLKWSALACLLMTAACSLDVPALTDGRLEHSNDASLIVIDATPQTADAAPSAADAATARFDATPGAPDAATALPDAPRGAADAALAVVDAGAIVADAVPIIPDGAPRAPDAAPALPDAAPPPPAPICGNGIVETGEQCDDGNHIDYDDCSNACMAQSPLVIASTISGVLGNSDSGTNGSISIDYSGRYVAFASFATNLVASDTNGQPDAFLHDMVTGTNTLISVSTDGVQANSDTVETAVSSTGRYVAFSSEASNLTADADSNGDYDIFVRDTVLNTTICASLSSSGGTGNGRSMQPSISADGRYVVFFSNASNLVAGDAGSIYYNVFLHDMQTGITIRMSKDAAGDAADHNSSNPIITPDGHYVVFESALTNLVPGCAPVDLGIFIYDVQAGTYTCGNIGPDGNPSPLESDGPSMSTDGRYVAWRAYDNGWQGFVYDSVTKSTWRYDVDSQGNPGDSDAGQPTLSADGRFVTFYGQDDNLAPNGESDSTDVYVHDNLTGVTSRASLSSTGGEGNRLAAWSTMSGNGEYVVFGSDSTNMVSSNTGNSFQTYRSSYFPQAGVLAVADSGFTSESGDQVNVSVVLGTQPTADVTVNMSLSDPAQALLSTKVVTFTADNWNVPQIVNLIGIDNSVVGGSSPYALVFNNATSNDPVYFGFASPVIALENLNDD